MIDRARQYLAVDPVVDSYWLVRQFRGRLKQEEPGPHASRVGWQVQAERADRAVSRLQEYIVFRRAAEEQHVIST